MGAPVCLSVCLPQGWQVTTTSESAASLFSAVFNFSTLLVVLPAGLATNSIGGKRVMALGFVLGAAVLAGFAVVQRFTPVMALACAFGVSWGTVSGAQTAVFAAALPSTKDSARDMNMFITAPVMAQLVVTYGGGHMLSWLGQTFHEVPFGTAIPTRAYGVLWLSGTLCFLLAMLPLRYVTTSSSSSPSSSSSSPVAVAVTVAVAAPLDGLPGVAATQRGGSAPLLFAAAEDAPSGTAPPHINAVPPAAAGGGIGATAGAATVGADNQVQ